jgi:hypothetical protein
MKPEDSHWLTSAIAFHDVHFRVVRLARRNSPIWPRPSGSRRLRIISCEQFRVARVNWLIVGHGNSAWETLRPSHMETLSSPSALDSAFQTSDAPGRGPARKPATFDSRR